MGTQKTSSRGQGKVRVAGREKCSRGYHGNYITLMTHLNLIPPSPPKDIARNPGFLLHFWGPATPGP